MKIVILGRSHNHTKLVDIATAVSEQGLPVHGIVLQRTERAYPGLREIVQRLHHEGSGLIFRKLRTFISSQFRRNNGSQAITSAGPPSDANGQAAVKTNGQLSAKTIQAYAHMHGIRLETVRDLNSPEAEALLRNMQPDLTLLGGTPIIRANILDIPRIGTLNVHQGLLPQYRGRNVAEWSVFLGDAVGISVHFVDPGVDTGDVLLRERIDVSDCRSIREMRVRLRNLQHRALARCARLVSEGKISPFRQSKSGGKQYYEMHAKLRAIVEHRLARGYHPDAHENIKPAHAQDAASPVRQS